MMITAPTVRPEDIPEVLSFEDLDKNNKITYYSDKLSMARKVGFTWFTEALHHLYYHCDHGMDDIAHMFDMTTAGLGLMFSRFGWPRGTRGGLRTYDGLYPFLGEVIHTWLDFPHKDDAKLRGKLQQELAKKYSVSTEALRFLFMGKTWKEEFAYYEKKYQEKKQVGTTQATLLIPEA